MDTATRLRIARERAGLTQVQVELYYGVGEKYVSKLERGENNPAGWDLVRKLARAYRTSTDWLLGLTEDYRPPENKTLPEGGSELLELLVRISPRGRDTLLSVAVTLAETDE